MGSHFVRATDSDGDCDASDVSAITGSYDVRKDLNLDGSVSATDSSSATPATLQRSAHSTIVNRTGFSGYRRSLNQWSARERRLNDSHGRWDRRDAILFGDGSNLYESVGSSPMVYVDAYGRQKKCKAGLGTEEGGAPGGWRAQLTVTEVTIEEGVCINKVDGACKFTVKVLVQIYKEGALYIGPMKIKYLTAVNYNGRKERDLPNTSGLTFELDAFTVKCGSSRKEEWEVSAGGYISDTMSLPPRMKVALLMNCGKCGAKAYQGPGDTVPPDDGPPVTPGGGGPTTPGGGKGGPITPGGGSAGPITPGGGGSGANPGGNPKGKDGRLVPELNK